MNFENFSDFKRKTTKIYIIFRFTPQMSSIALLKFEAFAKALLNFVLNSTLFASNWMHFLW